MLIFYSATLVYFHCIPHLHSHKDLSVVYQAVLSYVILPSNLTLHGALNDIHKNLLRALTLVQLIKQKFD